MMKDTQPMAQIGEVGCGWIVFGDSRNCPREKAVSVYS